MFELQAQLSLRVPAERAALPELRAKLTAFLTAHEVSDSDRRDALLVAHELAANAIIHGNAGRGEIEVVAEIEPGAVAITVRDLARGTTAPTPGSRNDHVESGRGLLLVDWLADWEAHPLEDQHEVKARLAIRGTDHSH